MIFVTLLYGKNNKKLESFVNFIKNKTNKPTVPRSVSGLYGISLIFGMNQFNGFQGAVVVVSSCSLEPLS